jgi:hypothetical protein
MCTIGLGMLAELSGKADFGIWNSVVVVIGTGGAVLVMVGGCSAVWHRLHTKKQGFGPNSIRAVGIFLFIPALLIISLQNKFATETLASLWGTVAGYVLSHIKPDPDPDTDTK